MKKISLWFLGSLCLIMLISYIDYYRYSKVINDFVGSVVTEISNKYPNVNSEDLIKIVNGSNNGKSNVVAVVNTWGKKNKAFFEELYQDIINKVPNVLAGYSKENMEKAKEMYKK